MSQSLAKPTAEEVLVATQKWLENAVIGLNLCPFAKAVYVKNQVRIVVSEAKHLDAFLEDLDRELLHLAEVDPQETDTTLLIHPTLLADFLTFNDVVAIAEEAVDEHGLEGKIQVANFHPDYQFDGTELEDLSNYTNRSPYPTLHLIRESSIEKAAEAFPDPAVIFDRNIALMEALGRSGCEAVLRGEKVDLPKGF
ncbi:DUF1415 domain-containing protein [Leeia sp. TBRC 13508]|uniref:DUF1415 domain-containing protein n=1 Tax=Leeia speluncae TaxID=2884804 RepID=A0ABS8D210_9NEIS|nr:DUF1415 domain-containing protein [Leeia speluncae]MCB6182021.1 DUF1415 domain-containing protein [Leeia speluncae]